MKKIVSFLLAALVLRDWSWGFVPLVSQQSRQWESLELASQSRAAAKQGNDQVDEGQEIQWNLFRKHQAKGSWKGIWTTYDYIGDVMDETVASVNYITHNNNNNNNNNSNNNDDNSNIENDVVIQQTHSIVSGAKRSDCATCFDSMELNEFPVAIYNPNDTSRPLFQKTRMAANAMVNGPSLLKSGVMATELVLSWGDGRVRVTFQHAPVWAADVTAGTGPPQGLKLVRTMISREALRETAPTAETEAANPPAEGNPIFYRPVPPFNWHKKWGGTSWTWGPSTGDRGWAIENLEEEDAWQGISTVERWNLRLPGGIFVQAPRVITDAQAELCRLAWLPDDETLLRVEAGCLALQPMIMEDNDELVGFYPPSLASLRCDVLKKLGELEQIPSFLRGGQSDTDDELAKPQAEEESQEVSASTTSSPPPMETQQRQEQRAKKEVQASSPAVSSKEAQKEEKSVKVTAESKGDDIRDVLSL